MSFSPHFTDVALRLTHLCTHLLSSLLYSSPLYWPSVPHCISLMYLSVPRYPSVLFTGPGGCSGSVCWINQPPLKVSSTSVWQAAQVQSVTWYLTFSMINVNECELVMVKMKSGPNQKHESTCLWHIIVFPDLNYCPSQWEKKWKMKATLLSRGVSLKPAGTRSATHLEARLTGSS